MQNHVLYNQYVLLSHTCAKSYFTHDTVCQYLHCICACLFIPQNVIPLPVNLVKLLLKNRELSIINHQTSN